MTVGKELPKTDGAYNTDSLETDVILCDVALKSITHNSRVSQFRYEACAESWEGGSVPLVAINLMAMKSKAIPCYSAQISR